MTSAQAKRVVVVSVLTMGGLAAVRQITAKKQGAGEGGVRTAVRMGVGLAVVAAVLTIAAETVPEVAGPFALLLLVASLVVIGGDVYAQVGLAVGANVTGAGSGGGGAARAL